LGDRGRQISEFKASLVYKVSSRTARAIQRNPVSKKKKNQNKQTKKFIKGGWAVLGRQGQADLYEFKARASSRTSRTTQKNPALKSQRKTDR
jgi:hypothetical protein